MGDTKKCWSKMVRVQGVSIRLYERPGGRAVYMSYISEGRKIQKTTKRSDRKEAETVAREEVERKIQEGLLGFAAFPTLGQLFGAYRNYRLPQLAKPDRDAKAFVCGLFGTAWGESKDVASICQSDVDSYCALRRSGEIGRHPVSVGTLERDFRTLNAILNWGRRHKVGRRSFIGRNPLADCLLPKERRPSQPVAHDARYFAVQTRTDSIDPAGRLRAILALTRYTGQGITRICRLFASDVLLSADAVRAALAEAGMDERDADIWTAGAIRWRGRRGDDRASIQPLSCEAREEIENYLRRNPRFGNAHLFTSPARSSEPLRRDTAAIWLKRAEAAACEPKMARGVFSPYARAFRRPRRSLRVLAEERIA